MTTLPANRDGRTYGRGLSLVREIAAQLDRTEGGVSQDLYGSQGCFRKSEDMLERLVAFGGTALAERQLGRWKKIVEQKPAPALTGALFAAESRADAEQDVARTELQTALGDDDPTNDLPAALRFIRRCDSEMALMRDVRDAVAARWGIAR